MGEWSSNNDYDTRVDNIRNGTGAHLGDTGIRLDASDPARTAFDDDDKDTLRGQKDRDWFFASLDDDKVNDRLDDEWLEDLANNNAVCFTFHHPNLAVNLQGERFMNEELLAQNLVYAGNVLAQPMGAFPSRGTCQRHEGKCPH